MEKSFFDLVGEGFFNPFSNSNKRTNYDLLLLINNKLSLDNLQVSKDEIVEWIVDYVDNCPIDLFDDETNDAETDIKNFAYEKVRYFVKCGWLIEDFEGIKVTYQMDENGIRLLSTMENCVKEDTKALEFSGYVYNIYSSLYNFNFDHSVEIVEQAYNASKELNSMLRGLNVNIKKFLKKLISENEAAPKEILETIFYDYQKKVVLKAFKNFREKDNPSKYKIYIEERIDDLLNKSINKLTNNYLRVKCEGRYSTDIYEEAMEFFIEKLNYIKMQFEDIEDYIQMLDKRNTRYITTAKSRLNFLLNEETNVEGRIVECLKGMADIDEEFFEESCVNLFVGTNLDKDSLSKPKVKKEKLKTEQLIEDEVIDEEELEKLKEKLLGQNEFSVLKINDFILNSLGKNSRIRASELKISNFEDMIKLFLSQVYSSNRTVAYKISSLESKIKVLDYQMNDFIIERK